MPSARGTVQLVFQPAEEGRGGAKRMIEDGAVDNVEAIFGCHLDGEFDLGTVLSRAGPIMAGSAVFEAVVIGKGGHAAIPQHTIDPILAASNVIVSLQHLVSREADPLDSQVVTVSKFLGGEAFNVIPDEVIIGGTLRAFSKESLSLLKQRITEVIKGQAAVQRCSATVDFMEKKYMTIPPTVNSRDLHELFSKVAGELVGRHNVMDRQPIMGAEDFSFFSDAVPAALYYYVGMRNASQGGPPTQPHSPFFTLNEAALPYGAALQAALAVQYLAGAGAAAPPHTKESHDEL